MAENYIYVKYKGRIIGIRYRLPKDVELIRQMLSRKKVEWLEGNKRWVADVLVETPDGLKLVFGLGGKE